MQIHQKCCNSKLKQVTIENLTKIIDTKDYEIIKVNDSLHTQSVWKLFYHTTVNLSLICTCLFAIFDCLAHI